MSSRARRKATVTATRNLEANLGHIERFLDSIGAGHRYDELVEDLVDRVVPLLERAPGLGSPFDPRGLPTEARLILESIRAKLDGGTLRQLVRGDFVMLYLQGAASVYLLAIRHHREATVRIGQDR